MVNETIAYGILGQYLEQIYGNKTTQSTEIAFILWLQHHPNNQYHVPISSGYCRGRKLYYYLPRIEAY